MRNLTVICLILVTVICSCKKEVKVVDVPPFIKPAPTGKFHFVEEEGVSVYLPLDFYPIKRQDFKALEEGITDPKRKQVFHNTVVVQDTLKDKSYPFMAEDNEAWMSLIILPHLSFNFQGSDQLLHYVKKRYDTLEAVAKVSANLISSRVNFSHSKLTVNAIYKRIDVSEQQENIESYDNVNIIKTNNKTIMLVLTTPEEVDFSKMISKIKMEDV